MLWVLGYLEVYGYGVSPGCNNTAEGEQVEAGIEGVNYYGN